MSEAYLLKEIELAIGALPGVLVFRNSVMVTDVETGRKKYLPGLGKGTPDLVVGVDGYLLGLEVKTADGRASPDQLREQAIWQRARIPYEFVRSVEASCAALERARRGGAR